MFDIAGFLSGRGLQRRSSSLLSHSIDHPSRSFSRELGGLMSWPENTYKAMQHRQDVERTGQQETNMSTRAMQLNIFGSMVSRKIYFTISLAHNKVYLNVRLWGIEQLLKTVCRLGRNSIYCLTEHAMSLYFFGFGANEFVFDRQHF